MATTYKLYLFDVDGHRLLPGIDMSCADDERAKKLGQDQADGRRGELWRGGIFVAEWPAKRSSR